MAPLEGQAPLSVELDEEGAGTVVRLAGELDISNVESLQAAIEPVLERRPERLDYDLSNLTFMDSSGIALMLRTAARVAAIRLIDPSDVVRRIVVATGLSDILHMEP